MKNLICFLLLIGSFCTGYSQQKVSELVVPAGATWSFVVSVKFIHAKAGMQSFRETKKVVITNDKGAYSVDSIREVSREGRRFNDSTHAGIAWTVYLVNNFPRVHVTFDPSVDGQYEYDIRYFLIKQL